MNYNKAKLIADNIVIKLQAYCDKIEIAGSLRRKKEEVGDIEIVALPKITEVAHTLFGEDMTKEVDSDFQMTVLNLGKAIKGKPTGRMMQIQIGTASDATEFANNCIMLDLFIPQPHDYFRQYAIRTGSADYSSKVIAPAWKKLGWCGTPDGLRRMEECIQKKTPEGKSTWKCCSSNPTLPPVWESEESFFEFLQIPFLKPELRN